MNKIYEYIVIGGGISGLYANYRLTKEKNLNGILLEKENDLGGRALEVKFHETLIKLGAGIFTKENKHLMSLLLKLNIKPNYFYSDKYSLLGYDFNMNNAIKLIIKKYNDEKDEIKKLKLNTKQFIKKYFGKEFTKKFIENCEYRDFLKSEPEYFIKFYKITDMSHDKEQVGIINWIDLINHLKLNNCIINSQVLRITKYNNIFKIFTNSNIYYTHKIYFALTLKPLDRLISKLINFRYSNFIGSIPFVRIYTWHKKPYDQTKIKHYNLVKNQLQKIVKINSNILMASYSDNLDAKYWKSILNKNKKFQINKVQNKLSQLNININKVDDIESCYWDEGVHYYKPFLSLSKLIKKLSNPSKNIYVIGEIVSKKHGWVEGCIESVDRVI